MPILYAPRLHNFSRRMESGKFLHFIFIFIFIFIFFGFLVSSAALNQPKLVKEEVTALKGIATKVGKKDWDFSKDPCSGEGNWSVPFTRRGFASVVSCNCTFSNGTICHVNYIALKAQNLTGEVPVEFAVLRHLRILDLSRNYLHGGIPSQWANMNLFNLSFMGNNLSGPFPTVLTRITTLVNLSLEGNRFSGSIPPEIGRLVNLENLILSSNYFTGKLPEELSNLTSLADLRLSDNNFTGKIPDFIGRMTKMTKLYMQGCSLNGPIPASISSLTGLTDLRISDLVEGRSAFPVLNEMKNLKFLILRKCFIDGDIPEYIGTMGKLQNLDLSFNNLSGMIPASFERSNIIRMYLNANRLTEQMQRITGRTNVDVSNNNFTLESSSNEDCPQENRNMVESHSSAPNNSIEVNMCFKQGFPCSNHMKRRNYYLHINCGGEGVNIGNVSYESDKKDGNFASMYYSSPEVKWAFSSTGNFMENDFPDRYIAANISTGLNSTSYVPELYRTARISPLSLTYYGLCLGNGSYNVTLHFAEIMFTNDSTFSSLGRRLFDVYLQGNLVLKDFDIAAEAGGPWKPIMRSFRVFVTSNTLKIHLYWAGRGTTGIPQRGTYGPLISAISVHPNFTPPPEPLDSTQSPAESRYLGAGTVAGITVGVFSMLVLIIGILHVKGYLGSRKPVEFSGLDLQTGLFTLRQIKAATNNFDPAHKIGEGGFGCVYKGLLSDGTIIAVKQLSSKSKQGKREFVNEIGMISALQHTNLVKLYGCCVEANQFLLVYEYMENNCLARALFGKDDVLKGKLDWKTRQKICLGIANGLLHLHEESKLKIVHRDIKASNVLLDKDFNAKISDFGLAKLHDEDITHITTRVAGTIGYMSPEYAMRGYLTPKADVYSFGVVLLELVSGKSNTNYKPNEDAVYLLDWAYVLQERGSLLELVDSDLWCEYSSKEAMLLLNVALLCTNASPTLRPNMSQVVSVLEGHIDIQEVMSDPGFSMVCSKAKSETTNFGQNTSSSQEMSTQTRLSDSSVLLNEMEPK